MSSACRTIDLAGLNAAAEPCTSTVLMSSSCSRDGCGGLTPLDDGRVVNDRELKRAANEARIVHAYVNRNPGVRDAVTALQRGLKTYMDSVQAVADWYTEMFNNFVHSMGGIEKVQEAVRTAATLLAEVHKALPPNWPGGLDYGRAIDIANDGIPVVWVPPAEILVELVAAPDRAARLALLHSHQGELLADVYRVLGEVTHSDLAGQMPLAQAAVDTWAGGQIEAAQSLAVTVVEAVVTRYHAKGRSYAKVREAAKIDLDDDSLSIAELRLSVALAPLWTFYTPWFPSSGDPLPDALSRHVTVHQADIGHYTADNALIAVLLVASMLRAFQEFLEEQDARSQP